MLHDLQSSFNAADVKLYSLAVPPLTRDLYWHRLAYLLSGLAKLGLIVAILTLLILNEHLKTTAVVVTSLNIALFTVSALLDLTVYVSAPKELPLDPMTGTVTQAWFSTVWSHRHRLCVVANRCILLLTAVSATLGASPPSSDWQVLDARLNIRLAVWMYLLMVVGSILPLITQFLWCSRVFVLWNVLAVARLGTGAQIVSIANRCFSLRAYMLRGEDPDFTLLPQTLQAQAFNMLSLLIHNAYLSGAFAYVGFVLASIAGWTRSKKWIFWNINFLIPTTIVVSASFVTVSHIQMINDMFCHYDEVFGKSSEFPAESPYADHMCEAIRANPRLKGQHWMTALLVLLTVAQVTLAVLMIVKTRWQPTEWFVADQMVLASLKRNQPLQQDNEELEEFVSTLTQRKSYKTASA